MSTIEVRTRPPVINLTDRATAKVAELLAQEGDDQLALRVAVKAGGCSGMSYEIFFDTATDPEDYEVVFGTVKVRVDPASAPHLAGATLEYKDGLQDAGFHIENPNAQRSCGCGQSFS
jgi:iron-sulfur cluster assembly accessory protein